MASEKVNLMIEQGTTVNISFNLTEEDGSNKDLSDYTARAQMRRHHSSANSVTFTCSISNSTVTMSLTAAQTAIIEPGRYVYDLEIVNSSNTVTRPIEGLITVRPEVTKI